METNYSLLKELSEDKQICMETLMNITEIEEYYQTVSAEIDSRALALCAAPCQQDDKPPTKGGRSKLSRHYNTCVYAVRSAWDWLIQEAKCQDVHLRNAAQYHQFYYEIKHYDQGLKNLLASVHHYDENPDKVNDSHAQVKEVQEVLQQLLDYQAKVDDLFTKSADIVPLYLRKYPSDDPIKIVALTSYKQSDLTIVEGEEYLLLDNSEVTKWKVRGTNGQEGLAPAIVFLIPPPDRTAVGAASRLRQQLYATWHDCTTLLKCSIRASFTQYLKSHNYKELRYLNPNQRNDVCQCLSEVGRVLCNNDSSNPESTDLYGMAKEWGTTVQKMEGTTPDRRGWANSLVLHWSSSKKLLRLLEELELYSEAYKEALASSRGTKNCFLMDEDNNITYTSKAYVERLRPVDIDHLIPTATLR